MHVLKFVKYNDHTKKNLQEKTVYYSTVLKMNDELEKCAPIWLSFHVDFTKEAENIKSFVNCLNSDKKTKEELFSKEELLDFAELYYENNNRNYKDHEKYITEFFDKNLINDDPLFLIFLSLFLFLKRVGIFCFTNITSMIVSTTKRNTKTLLECLPDGKKEQAKLDRLRELSIHPVIAHYADNYSGLGLIYKTTKTPIKVIYTETGDTNQAILKNEKPKIKKVVLDVIDPSKNHEFAINEFIEEKNIDSIFREKQISWDYERELRLFGVPGLHSVRSIEEDGMELVAILCPRKFKNIDELNKINKSEYGGKLKIKKLTLKNCNFYIDGIPAPLWIKENLKQEN